MNDLLIRFAFFSVMLLLVAVVIFVFSFSCGIALRCYIVTAPSLSRLHLLLLSFFRSALFSV